MDEITFLSMRNSRRCPIISRARFLFQKRANLHFIWQVNGKVIRRSRMQIAQDSTSERPRSSRASFKECLRTAGDIAITRRPARERASATNHLSSPSTLFPETLRKNERVQRTPELRRGYVINTEIASLRASQIVGGVIAAVLAYHR